MSAAAEGPVCTMTLPMQWVPRVAATDTMHTDACYRRNLRLLEVVASLEASQEDAGDDGNPVTHRLGNKLDLLMEMVSVLISDHSPPPPRIPLTLTRSGASWSTSSPPAVGELLDIIIRLHPDLAYDLRAPARVEGCQDEADQVRVHARFEWTGDLLASWERWVFRQHRRAVARERSAPQAD